MANESQYYNPIIQAMAQTVAAQQNQQKLEQQQEQMKQQVAASKLQGQQNDRAHALAELSEKHHNEHENKMLDIQDSLLRVQQQTNAMSRLKSLRDYISSGGDEASFNQITGQGGAPPVSGTPTTQQFQSAAASGAGAIAGAKTKAEQDILFPQQQQLLQQSGQQSLTLQQAQQAARQKLQDQQIFSNEKIAKMSEGTQYGIAQMHNNTALKVAGLDPSGGTSDLVKNLTLMGASGQVKLSPANPLERLAISNIQDMGWQIPDAKEISAMKTSQKLLPLFDRLRDYANNLPDDRTAATLQGYGLHAKRAIDIGSKQQTDLDNILTQAMSVGTALESMTGRPLSAQLKLDLNGLVAPGNTKSDALSKINNMQNTYINNQENVTQAGMPDSQKEFLYHSQGVKPSFLAIAPGGGAPTSKLGGKLNFQKSLQQKTAVYDAPGQSGQIPIGPQQTPAPPSQ